ncbi:nucleoside triphosphate pyrophosphohydrolase [Kineosporia mesophila]|uniref:Nucleoside triphosphate pyrophosphohydrolase n=1 Tax=Kineosporia mesophila TaxID=566012 RepID=A0ABP6YVM6_9ACTN|nr:MazG family protein [Kineosporia mesophila]
MGPEHPTPPDAGRVTILLTSPRTAPGLLSFSAWDRLRSAGAVLAVDPDPAWLEAFAAAGVTPEDVSAVPVAERAGRLVEDACAGQELVWWGSEDGDPGLTDALAEHLSRRAVVPGSQPPPEVEVLTGSYDVPGSRLLDLVAVMDTLRSPGGCPWDGEQTHTSLLPYLLEEAHEVIEAVESGDPAHVQEELGDLLLQVVFHARVAEEEAGFGIDEVAAGIVAKLIRRHPHVFGDGEAESAQDVEVSWEALKAAEKAGRQGFEGIPATLPALARAQKMIGRLSRAGADLDEAVEKAADGDELAAALLRLVVLSRVSGQDAEATLRAALGRLVPPSQ